jgi:hypothetical protein
MRCEAKNDCAGEDQQQFIRQTFIFQAHLRCILCLLRGFSMWITTLYFYSNSEDDQIQNEERS